MNFDNLIEIRSVGRLFRNTTTPNFLLKIKTSSFLGKIHSTSNVFIYSRGRKTDENYVQWFIEDISLVFIMFRKKTSIKVTNVYFRKQITMKTTETTSRISSHFLFSVGGRERKGKMSEINVHAAVPLPLTTEKFSRKFMFQVSYTKGKEDKKHVHKTGKNEQQA